MAEPDWTNRELDHRLRCLMVDPNERTHNLGELELELDGNSVTWEWESDTVASARVAVRDWTRWVPNSWLRLVHEVPSCGYSRDLFCGFVWDEGSAGGPAGYWGAAPTLMGAAKALETDRLAWPMSCGAGARAKDALVWLCESALCTWHMDGTVPDYRFNASRVFDAGATKMDVALEICGLMGARHGVDGRGNITFTADSPLSSKAPKAVLDCDADDSMVISAGMTRRTGAHQAASRMIVSFKDGDDQVSGYADVDATNPASAEARGYRVAVHETPNDAPEPHDQWRAQQEARARLPEASAYAVEWDCESLWLPLEAGDVVDFRPPAVWREDGTREVQEIRRCAVWSCEADLSRWRLRLTLREV